MSGVRKAFPGVVALDNVSFQVESGEIRALMGENGAGKSTLIKVLTGVHAMDAGSIVLDSQSVRPSSPAHAQTLGISTVYQEVNLALNLSVAENICLGDEPRSFGFVSWSAMHKRARTALSRLGLEIDTRGTLGSFSIAVQQMVAIARAIDRKARVLVLDEPTSSLDKAEVATLFDLMRRLKGEGMAIVFITHFLDQVFEVADSVTVLRNGVKVCDSVIGTLTRDQLVSHMLGRELEDVPRTSHRVLTETGSCVEVDGLGKSRYMQPVTFSAKKGEAVGLAGLLGSGRSETLRLVFGAVAADSGRVVKDGETFTPRRPNDAIRRGIGYCPEERKVDGICPGLSVTENILLVLQARRGWMRRVSISEAEAIVSEFKQRLKIKVDHPSRPIETLSGGNQQKVILSRWLASDPDLLLLDEPTRGIDIGSKADVRRFVMELCEKGKSFVFTSSEIDEVVDSCHRIVVLRDREKVGELEGSEVSESAVLRLIAQGSRP